MNFDEASMAAASAARRELRESGPQRLIRYGGSQQRRSDCHEAFMGGHAKGFAAGWSAATGQVVSFFSSKPDPDLEAMAREVCGPFDSSKALRAGGKK